MFVRTSDHIRYLTTIDAESDIQTIETTDAHPFWVVTDNPDLSRAAGDFVIENGTVLYHENLAVTEHGYYVEAKDLTVGDVFIGANGELTTLTGTERVEFPNGITVYNFTVADNHNYFIIADVEAYENGASVVLVHNAGKTYLSDKPTSHTVNSSQQFNSEGEARNFARRVLGKEPIQLPDNKMRRTSFITCFS